MAKRRPSLTGDLKQISECSLYRDPRVSRRARLHTFCGECKESSTINQDSCPLCRPFFRIPEEGCESIPRNQLMEKLIDLHQMHLEKNLNLNGEQIIDLPLVEVFEIKENYSYGCPIAWVEDKLYVAFNGISSVRVFADRAPFEELDETIEIEGMDPYSMTSSAADRSIFIGDSKGCIWKIQLPERKVSRWEVDGRAFDLSITPNGKLLVGVTGMDKEYRSITCSCQLNVFDLTNSSRKVIPLPKKIIMIFGVAQTQNENFVISYGYERPWCWYMVSILSSDGVHIIRTVGPESLDLNPRNSESFYNFVVMDDGQILASDCTNDKLLIVNSDLTGCRILSDNGQTFGAYTNIVYVREKRQLFVHKIKRNASDVLSAFIYAVHLSPCYSEAQISNK